MKLISIVDEDFVNYKKPSMFIIFPKCSWKCDKECGRAVCQNGALAKSPVLDISIKNIINRYINNSITKAVVCGGLEPFDSFDDLLNFVNLFRKYCSDDIVIYTGYTEKEIKDKVMELLVYSNIIIKYGRFIPNEKPYFNEELGVKLAGENQYAVRYN